MQFLILKLFCKIFNEIIFFLLRIFMAEKKEFIIIKIMAVKIGAVKTVHA